MATQKRYWVRRPMPGYNGKPYDQGELIRLVGAPNDEALVRLGYVEEFTPKKGWKPFECRECGGKFLSQALVEQHGRRQHRPRELDPHREDQRAEADERRFNETAPLYLDRTKAAMSG